MKSLLKCLRVLAFTLVLLNTPAAAQTRQSALNVGILDPTDIRQETTILGWAFTVDTNVVLQSLGIYVPVGQDAGGGTGEVALWSVHNAQFLTGFNVEFDDPMTGRFRYHDLPTPLTLQAGTEYVIGVYYQELQFQVMATSGRPATAPGINFLGFRQEIVFNDDPGMPTQVLPDRFGLLGPNFQFTPALTSAAAPEPTSGLLVPGTLLMAGAGIRRRTRNGEKQPRG